MTETALQENPQGSQKYEIGIAGLRNQYGKLCETGIPCRPHVFGEETSEIRTLTENIRIFRSVRDAVHSRFHRKIAFLFRRLE